MVVGINQITVNTQGCSLHCSVEEVGYQLSGIRVNAVGRIAAITGDIDRAVVIIIPKKEGVIRYLANLRFDTICVFDDFTGHFDLEVTGVAIEFFPAIGDALLVVPQCFHREGVLCQKDMVHHHSDQKKKEMVFYIHALKTLVL